jgi:glucokinase
VIRESVSLLRAVRDAAPAALRETLAGIGIAAPGPVQPSTGQLVEPPNLGPAFRDVPLAGPIGTALGLPAMLERDTNVAALAEWDFGSARATRDFLYLTVSTGIGGAIVTGGRLMRGPDEVAGELGHVVVELDGPPCRCGARGHLEAISSGAGIARAAADAIAAGVAPGLVERRRAAARPLTARDVAAAEDAADPAAAAIMERARKAFAEACVGFVNVFNPELIVVGGSLARNQGERWLDPTRDRIGQVAFRIHRARVRVVPAALGDDVGLVGALPLLRGRAAV